MPGSVASGTHWITVQVLAVRTIHYRIPYCLQNVHKNKFKSFFQVKILLGREYLKRYVFTITVL